MILDYTNHITEEFDKIHEDFFQPIPELIRNGFFKKNQQYCRFCKTRLATPHYESEDNGGAKDFIEVVYDCTNCGWWHYRAEESMYVGEGNAWHSYNYLWGLLRQYKENAVDIPLATLRSTLKNRPEIIYQMNPRKFEELVGSVFKDFYECEVRHVGKSHDGGIDLILVRSDYDTIVQVKRRQKPEATEGVSVIRELIGTMALERNRNAVFVSSASKFSNEAKKASNKAASLGVVDQIELIDYTKFIDIMELTHKVSDRRPWQIVINL